LWDPFNLTVSVNFNILLRLSTESEAGPIVGKILIIKLSKKSYFLFYEYRLVIPN
jgi:hypothetical protein